MGRQPLVFSFTGGYWEHRGGETYGNVIPTLLRLFRCRTCPSPPVFCLEWGAHKPTPAEASAPFYQDPAQRIIALHKRGRTYLVFRVGVLLELAKKNERPLIRWKEWGNRVFVPCIEEGNRRMLFHVQVAGCRLFAIYSTHSAPACEVEVFDFSMQGRVRYFVERYVRGLDVVKFLQPTGAVRQMPWEPDTLHGLHCGHDSIVFSRVSDSVPPFGRG